MDFKKPFNLKNVSNGRVVIGAFVLESGENKDILQPYAYNEDFYKKVQVFLERKHLIGKNVDKTFRESNYEKKDVQFHYTGANNNQHVVYKPGNVEKVKSGKLIEVKEHTPGKSIDVKEISSEGGSVETGFSEIDKIEAKDFLNQHWKKVETQLKDIKNKRKLRFYLSVADAEGVLEKKQGQLIEERLKELES